EQIVLAAKQQSTFLESVRGIQAIKLFGRESQRLAVWQNRLVDTTNRVLKTQRFMIGYRLALGLLGAVESILVVWIGAQLILGGVFSIGMLFAFVAYKGVFSARMSSLIDKAVELRMLRLQGERLADIVLTSREANGEPEGMGDTSLPSLCLDAVSFRYSELDPWVLRETRLTIPAGAAMAIVGPSGCGKTTLAKLLLGLLRPTAGRIAVQGRERSLSDAGHLRYITGAVMQDDHLFTGSLADNIAFFDPRPDLEKIERVARLACIHDDIRHMAMGYHTLVGDMGTALSGGQRQRILLARALYREPKILVLDEATSHLDVALERAINDAVRGLKMTRIVIAHRPETIAACDLVVELPSVNQVEPPALAAP
ncbi:peptidase domain-containing ABC transporter, partial [Hydrogenophaga borbori]|uniref:peptidase domain-containing ABC transporter n=1 Tax=Hydrogenophaga borbori TaxID=2294117 RepID=UPI00301B7C25